MKYFQSLNRLRQEKKGFTGDRDELGRLPVLRQGVVVSFVSHLPSVPCLLRFPWRLARGLGRVVSVEGEPPPGLGMNGEPPNDTVLRDGNQPSYLIVTVAFPHETRTLAYIFLTPQQ